MTLEETSRVFSLSLRQNGIYSVCQNDEGEGATEAHVEVIDRSIRITLSPQKLLLKVVLSKERRKRKLLEDHVLTFLLICWKNCVNWDSFGLRLEKC